jgi:hypothetical protein
VLGDEGTKPLPPNFKTVILLACQYNLP